MSPISFFIKRIADESFNATEDDVLYCVFRGNSDDQLIARVDGSHAQFAECKKKRDFSEIIEFFDATEIEREYIALPMCEIILDDSLDEDENAYDGYVLLVEV